MPWWGIFLLSLGALVTGYALGGLMVVAYFKYCVEHLSDQ